MKKRYIIFFMILCVSIFSICLFIRNQSSNNPVFFMQYENYIAASKGEDLELALSFFGGKNEVNQLIKATSASFDDKAIRITQFEIKEGGPVEEFYSGSIYVTCNFLEDGIWECSTISLTYPDNTTMNFPVGQWIFDVEGTLSVEVPIDIWGSPIASTNSNKFPYSYLVESDLLVVEAIQYGRDLLYWIPKGESENNYVINGSLDLPGDAPVKYIRPKLHITYEGKPLVIYGIGCYCGAFNVSLNEIELSQKIAMSKEGELFL